MDDNKHASDARRALKACIPCKAGKRKCDFERPCGACCMRGMQSKCVDEEKDIDPACSICSKRKLKCDRRRPCGRCFRQGLIPECIADALSSQSVPKRQRDEGTVSLLGMKRRKTAVPNAAALFGGNALGPEQPIAFPEGTFSGWSAVIPPTREGDPWPKSLVRTFKTYRTADDVYCGILNNMPPRLLSTVLQIFRGVDVLFGLQQNPQPARPDELNTSSSWHSSLRCGMQTVRMDKGCGVMTGVEVNPFWSTLAGMHREEFVTRAFNGEMRLPTSELRQACKLFYGVRAMLESKLGGAGPGQGGDGGVMEMKPLYSRFTQNWGRGAASAGVMTRMRMTLRVDGGGEWVYWHHSLVVVSPEEYEAVRAASPELCEGHLIPVVGSKSAAELMAPELLEEESFERMSQTEEGRAALDRLADKLAHDFQFLFDFIGSIGAGSGTVSS